MLATYTLTNGSKIRAFLWQDVLEGKEFRDYLEVTPVLKTTEDGRMIKGKEKIVPIFRNGNDPAYFMWEDEKVVINDFDADSLEELQKKIELARTTDYYLSSDEMLSAFLKADTIKIKTELPVYETIVPELGLGFTGDKRAEVTCVVTEKHYPRTNWGYKLTLEAENEELRMKVASRDWYFSDLYSAIVRNHGVDLVV